jgi:hypothetical protein
MERAGSGALPRMIVEREKSPPFFNDVLTSTAVSELEPEFWLALEAKPDCTSTMCLTTHGFRVQVMC